MASQYLHIVAFNIPHPANYGGVIDVYYKVRALSEAGIRIILHCYQYGRSPSKELEDLCFKVYYYRRPSGLRYLLRSDPYIVVTRNSKSMPDHLLRDSFPVLFEGLHCTAQLANCVQANKKILVRAHNIEHKYYRSLARSERSALKKLFFLAEARKLRKYEGILKDSDCILGISLHECEYFEKAYGNALFIPAFHRFTECSSAEGSGEYILFHGNLGIRENSKVFLSLVKAVLSGTRHKIIVAGKDPSRRFIKKLGGHANIRLVANPGDLEMAQLIRDAQINLLVTRQTTGMKLKLLHALYAGRHCLVNPDMVYGTGLEDLCTVAAGNEEMLAELDRLMVKPFTLKEIQARKKALKEYSNRTSAEKIMRMLA